MDALYNGVDIVVGTPGRLDDLVSSNDLLLNNIRFFVLDEADGLLSQGHGQLINRFHGKIPPVTADGKRLQMIVCSATLHNMDVKKLAVSICVVALRHPGQGRGCFQEDISMEDGGLSAPMCEFFCVFRCLRIFCLDREKAVITKTFVSARQKFFFECGYDQDLNQFV